MGQAVYVARVNTKTQTVENVEVADSDWLANDAKAVTGYAFIPYSSGEEVSLGTGTWIADGMNPPQPSHFCALDVFHTSQNTFYINETDRLAQNMSHWDEAQPGDTLTIYCTDSNSARYLITTVGLSRGVWTVEGKLIEGKGQAVGGQRHDVSLWSKHSTNTPEVGGTYAAATQTFQASDA